MTTGPGTRGLLRAQVLDIIRSVGDDGITVAQVTACLRTHRQAKTEWSRQAVHKQIGILIAGNQVRKEYNHSGYCYRLVACLPASTQAGGDSTGVRRKYKFYDRESTCSICAGNFTNVAGSFGICQEHQDWMVTVCKVCGVKSFSDGKGYCVDHGPADVPMWRGEYSPACAGTADRQRGARA